MKKIIISFAVLSLVFITPNSATKTIETKPCPCANKSVKKVCTIFTGTNNAQDAWNFAAIMVLAGYSNVVFNTNICTDWNDGGSCFQWGSSVCYGDGQPVF